MLRSTRAISYPFAEPLYAVSTEATMTFKEALAKAIDSQIRTEKREGTVGMSVNCLKQMVRPPNTSLPGAPNGTNAAYYYSELFREVIAESSARTRFTTVLAWDDDRSAGIESRAECAKAMAIQERGDPRFA